MLDFVSKENSFQTKVNPTTDTVQKKELVDNSSESVYDNLKNGINTIQMKQTSNSSTIQFEKGYAFEDTKSDKGRGKLGRIFKGGLLGAVATYEGGYGSEEERRDFKKKDRYMGEELFNYLKEERRKEEEESIRLEEERRKEEEEKYHRSKEKHKDFKEKDKYKRDKDDFRSKEKDKYKRDKDDSRLEEKDKHKRDKEDSRFYDLKKEYGTKQEYEAFKKQYKSMSKERIDNLFGQYRGGAISSNKVFRSKVIIDIPGKKKGSTNKLRGDRYESVTSEKNGKAVILFSGSGGNNRDQLQPIAEQYTRRGYVCYGIDYRGFGQSGTEKSTNDKKENSKRFSSGMISENRIYEDARIIYNYVLSEGYSPNNIILHGFSLGGAVASNLAVEISQKAQGEGDDYKLGGLVMHSPMTSTFDMGKEQGNEMLKGIGGLLGSFKTKGAMGSMSTKKNLLALQELDADLPVAFMSGTYKMIGQDKKGKNISYIGDHLDYTHTGIANYFKGKNVDENTITYAKHLETDKFGELNLAHMRKWKDMHRSNPVPTTQTKSIDSVRHTPSSEQTVQGKFESSNNTGLPDGLKTNIESLSGYSMNDVKVHYNSPKPAQMKALAYTQGTDIHVAPGQEKHLGHEAWHVVQQKQGRVQPTTQMKGVNINDNASLEREADIMGTKATQLKAINNKDTVQKKTIQ